MNRYKLSRPAAKDLDEIWLALALEESLDFATRVVGEISHIFPMLGVMPESGRLRPEFKPNIRSFPVGDSIIYYNKAKRGGVEIWRVIHGKRNQMRALRGRNRMGLR
jgi:toxin ParE1/3/4